jgi:hypothetical protein
MMAIFRKSSRTRITISGKGHLVAASPFSSHYFGG